MGKYFTQTEISQFLKTKQIHMKAPSKNKNKIYKKKSQKKAFSSNSFDEKTESLLFQISQTIRQKLENLAQNRISYQQKKSLLTILKGSINLDTKDIGLYFQQPSQQFFTSIENLVPKTQIFQQDQNHTMNLMSCIFPEDFIMKSNSYFLIYFTILLQRFLQTKKQIKIQRSDFKQLIKIIWNITQKYLCDNISIIERKKTQNFQAQWFVLESLDFNLQVPLKQLFLFQTNISG